MLHNFSGANWIWQQQLQDLTRQMQIHAGPWIASLRAYALTNSALDKQAQLWAYVDVFRYIALMLVLCVPLSFILKKPSSGQAGAA
jgi:hypothetical protein